MAEVVSITGKLGNMRQDVEWTVYPPQKDGRIIVQSDHRIAVFHDDGSNKGLLSEHKANGAYFAHLSPACGAKVVDVPQAFISAAVGAQPQHGDTIGNGAITILVL